MIARSRRLWWSIALCGILLVPIASGCTPAASEPQDKASEATPAANHDNSALRKAAHPAEYAGIWKMQAAESTTKNVLTFQPDGAFAITTEYLVKDNRGEQTQKQNKKGTWGVRDSILEFQYPDTPTIRYRAEFSGKDRLTLVRQGIKNGDKVIYNRVK